MVSLTYLNISRWIYVLDWFFSECYSSKGKWSEFNPGWYWSQQFRQVGLVSMLKIVRRVGSFWQVTPKWWIILCFSMNIQCGCQRRQETVDCSISWWSWWTSFHTQGAIIFDCFFFLSLIVLSFFCWLLSSLSWVFIFLYDSLYKGRSCSLLVYVQLCTFYHLSI